MVNLTLTVLLCVIGFYFTDGWSVGSAPHRLPCTKLNMVASDVVRVRDPSSPSSSEVYSENWELELRRSIHKKQWETTQSLLSGLPPNRFTLPSGRNIVYIVSETCRVGRAYEFIVPLLSTIGTNRSTTTTITSSPEAEAEAEAENSKFTFMCHENDVMPALETMVKRRRTDEARELMRYLKGRGVVFSAKAYALLVYGYGRAGDEERLEQTLGVVKRERVVADTVLFNSVLDAYIRCASSDDSGSSSSSSKSGGSLGAQKAWTLYSAVIGTLSQTDIDALEPPLLPMVEYAYMFRPQLKELQVASEGEDEGEDEGGGEDGSDTGHDENPSSSSSSGSWNMRPNVVTFNTMLKGARVVGGGSRRYSFGRCQTIIAHMLERRVEPDSVTINTLVTACVVHGRLEEAEAFLYMEEGLSGAGTRIAPGVEAYSSLISGYAAIGDDKGAFRTYTTMRREGILPNGFTLTALMDSCLRAGKAQRARQYLDSGVPALYEQPVVVSEAGLETEGQGQRKLRTTKQELALGAQELTALHGAYVAGTARMAVERIEQARSYAARAHGEENSYNNYDNVNSSEYDAPTELLAAAQAAHSNSRLMLARAALALDEMVNALGIAPDTVTMNAFLKALCAVCEGRPRLIQEALLLFTAMRQPSTTQKQTKQQQQATDKTGTAFFVAPDDFTYSILFTAMGRAGYVSSALQLLQMRYRERGSFSTTIITNNKRKEKQASLSLGGSSSSNSRSESNGNGGEGELLPGMDVTATNSLLSAFLGGDAAPLAVLKMAFSLHPKLGDAVNDRRSDTTATTTTSNIGKKADSSVTAARELKEAAAAEQQGVGQASCNSPPDVITFQIVFAAVTKLMRFYCSGGSTGNGGAAADSSGNTPAYTQLQQLTDNSSRDDDEEGEDQYLLLSGLTPEGPTNGALGAAIRSLSFLYLANPDSAAATAPTPVTVSSTSIDREVQQAWDSNYGDDSSSSGATAEQSRSSDSDDVMMGMMVGKGGARTATATSISKEALDRLLVRSYNSMRDDFKVIPDAPLVSTLNRLFLISHSQSQSSFNDNHNDNKNVFSKATARVVFEDLVCLGTSPEDLPAVLRACGYTPRQENDLRNNRGGIVDRMRKNRASTKLFRKYGWNSFDSGWTGFF